MHHLTTELFKSMTGIDLVHVPYKGSAPGAVALVAGEAKLHEAFAAAIAAPEVSAKMTSFGVTSVAGSTPKQFGALMRTEYDTFGKLIKQVGAKID